MFLKAVTYSVERKMLKAQLKDVLLSLTYGLCTEVICLDLMLEISLVIILEA